MMGTTSRIFGVLLLGALAAQACTIPVFRYALDRWQADHFGVVAGEAWKEGDAGKALAEAANVDGANLSFAEPIDGPGEVKILWPGTEEVFWAGGADAAVVKSLTSSPVREEIAKRIVAGASAVWVLVESGEKEKDDAFAERLAKRLKYLESVATIPPQDPTDPESKLGPGPELKVGFSMLRVKRDDAKDPHLAKMLAGPDRQKLLDGGGPFAAAVFARGRVLGAWSAEELDDAGVDEISLFLLGACSCRVKTLNPGWDLIMAVDWDERLMAIQMKRGAEGRTTSEGVMAKALMAVVVVLVLGVGGLVWTHQRGRSAARSEDVTLTVYCAAGIKKPVAAAAGHYRDELGVEVNLQYGGTGTLLSQLQVAKRGDLFVAADVMAIAKAREAGVAMEVIPLCRQYPVIAVPDGNPKGIKGIDDLFRDNLKVAVANPEAASIGKATRKGLADRWEALAAKVVVMKPTVTELAADLTIGSIDAAVLWNSTVPQFEGLETVRAPEFDAQLDTVSIAVLAASKQPPEALKFARYLAAPEKGGAVFTAMGFEAMAGDAWAERPELILFSGGVNRPAVEKTLAEFSEREGVEVTTVFNGCGILCASMKAMKETSNPKFPDAYYACDLCFVPPVAEVFPESHLLTETEIGITVRTGNPKEIKTLADLARPGLRVGICNAEQSTLGFMTAGMLQSSALYDAIRKNVVVETPTADFLVNQMRAGALDAAIVYRVNSQLQDEHLDFLQIRHEGARAVQPFAVRADSNLTQLAGRLLDTFKANRERFETAGFRWLGDQPPVKSAEIEVPPWLLPPSER